MGAEGHAAPRAARLSASASVAGLTANLFGTFAWAFTGVFIKIISVSGLVLPCYRLWLSFLLMPLAALVSRQRVSWAALRASAFGGACFVVNMTLFFNAVKLTSIADATFIGALQPLLVLVVANRLWGERLTRGQVACMAFAIGGVALVVLGGPDVSHGELAGDALAVAAAFAFTGYWVASKHARSTLSTVEYMTGMLLVAAILSTPLALLASDAFVPPGRLEWVYIGLLALVPSVGHFLFNWAHRQVPATLSAILQSTVPVFATAAAVIFLAEPIAGLQVLGGVIAVLAVAAICVQSADLGEEAVRG